MRYSSTPLYPGEYMTGRGLCKITAEDIRALAKNTTAMLRAGLNVPVLPKHDDVSPSEERSAMDNVGWLHSASVAKDGGLKLVFDILDPECAKAIDQGRIKKLSPDIINKYVDGKMRSWGAVLRNVALSLRPVNPDQEDISKESEPAVTFAFSEAETAGLALTVDDPIFRKPRVKASTMPHTVTEEQANGPRKNEMPKEGLDTQRTETAKPDGDSLQSKLASLALDQIPGVKAALLAELLAAVGVQPPSVSSPLPQWLEGLVSALQTKVAQNAIESNSPSAASLGLQATHAVVHQFSEHPDPAVRKLAQEHEELVARIKAEKRAAHINSVQARLDKAPLAPYVKKALSDKLGAIQFSEDNTELPTVTIEEAIDLVEAAVPEGARLPDGGGAKTPEHPLGQGFWKSTAPSDANGRYEYTKEEVDEIIRREEAMEYSAQFAKGPAR